MTAIVAGSKFYLFLLPSVPPNTHLKFQQGFCAFSLRVFCCFRRLIPSVPLLLLHFLGRSCRVCVFSFLFSGYIYSFLFPSYTSIWDDDCLRAVYLFVSPSSSLLVHITSLDPMRHWWRNYFSGLCVLSNFAQRARVRVTEGRG